MLTVNGRKNYTASGNEQAERLIDSVLEGIGNTLQSTSLSVYLGGSYGRGEGGVRLDSENGVLYNDLDFFVFARNVKWEDEKLLHEIAHRYEVQLKVDVDFSRITSIREIKRNQKRLMMQELKRGYRLVCGDDLLAEYLPEIPAEKLPFSEACRLLLNRGMGLRFAGEKIAENSTDSDFILRNIYKAILGSGDARLIAEGKYRWRIAQRLEAIENSSLPDRWKKLYAEAVRFKSSPHRNMPPDLRVFSETVKEFFQASVLAVSGAENWELLSQKMYEQCCKSGEISILNYVKYCVKTRKLHRVSKFLKMPPSAVVLCRLCDPEVCRSELYSEWLKFN